MASSVFYKFKSQRDESRVTFDGTGISVFDLKKEIILANNLAKANDFDLAIYDRSSNEGALLPEPSHSPQQLCTHHHAFQNTKMILLSYRVPRQSSLNVCSCDKEKAKLPCI